MKFRHKNFGKHVVRIHDSKFRTYDLGYTGEVVIDKPSPRDTVRVIEQVMIKKKRLEYDLNNDGVFDKKDLSIAGKVLSKSKKTKEMMKNDVYA